MPRGRSRSRSRSRSRTPTKRMPRRRRSRSRSSSGSPHYEKKRKPAGHGRRYSRGSQSPRPRQFSQDALSRDRKQSRRSASSSPERSRQKSRLPKRPYSRSRSVTPQEDRRSSKPPGPRFDTSVLGSSNLTDFEMRIRELQTGSTSKFTAFVEEGPSRQVRVPNEKTSPSLQPPGGYGQNHSASKFLDPPRDGSKYDRMEPATTQSFSRGFQQQGYHTQNNAGKGQRLSRSRSPSQSPPRRRQKSITPPVKHRKKSYSPPRRKSKYQGESPPPRKRSKDKKSRRGEGDRKKSPPRSSRLGPGIDSSLIVIPRRKDEGTTPIFDRPEIPVYTIRDDPSLIAEGYFDKEDSQRARSPQTVQSARSYAQEPRDGPRPPSPRVTFTSTGLDKYNFPNSAAYFERRKEPAQIVSTTLGEIHDRMRSSIQASGLQVDHLPNTDLRLALERKQLSPLRGSFTSDLLSQETMLYEREKMNRSLSEERRPVKERLGGKKDGGLPDFRKEVDMLNQTDPLLTPKGGGYFQHDNRDNEGNIRTPYTSPMRRPPIRGFSRGRGGYRGNNYIRGFRGRFSRGYSGYNRGGYQGSYKERDRWTHNKFEDDRKSSKKAKHSGPSDDKSSKKEKKSKKTDRERRSSHHKS